MGLRLQLRKQQAEAGDIVLLYGDESEALTHPYLARAWAKSGADLRVPAPGQAKKVAMLGSLDHVTRQLIVHTSPTKRSSDFIAHLEQLDRLFGPQPGRQAKPVVLVEDNGPIHTSKRSLAALAARAHWLTVEWLPKYAPELNEIEPVWRDLKAHHLAHQTFTDVNALDQAIHDAVIDLNRERIPDPLAMPRISAESQANQQRAKFGHDEASSNRAAVTAAAARERSAANDHRGDGREEIGRPYGRIGRAAESGEENPRHPCKKCANSVDAHPDEQHRNASELGGARVGAGGEDPAPQNRSLLEKQNRRRDDDPQDDGARQRNGTGFADHRDHGDEPVGN